MCHSVGTTQRMLKRPRLITIMNVEQLHTAEVLCHIDAVILLRCVACRLEMQEIILLARGLHTVRREIL
jgi:hypothetical protein